MAIVTTHYRPNRPPRKRHKKPAPVALIVTPAPVKKRLGRVIRLHEQEADTGQEQPRRPAIVTPRRKQT
jgi:hypothetical protein